METEIKSNFNESYSANDLHYFQCIFVAKKSFSLLLHNKSYLQWITVVSIICNDLLLLKLFIIELHFYKHWQFISIVNIIHDTFYKNHLPPLIKPFEIQCYDKVIRNAFLQYNS